MRAMRAIVRNEIRLMLKEFFPIMLLILMPLVLLAFLSHGLVGGPAHAVPGLATLFAFLGLSTVSYAFFRDHGWNTWNNFRTSPNRPIEVIVAKALPLVGLFVLQLAVLLSAGYFLFGMPWRASPAAGIALVLAVVAAEVSLGLVLTATCRSIYQVNAFANLGGLILAGLGGALSPVPVLPLWMQRIAPVSPAYWALKGFETVILEGGGIGSVAGPVAVLTGVTAAALTVVVWRYRFDAPKTFYA